MNNTTHILNLEEPEQKDNSRSQQEVHFWNNFEKCFLSPLQPTVIESRDIRTINEMKISELDVIFTQFENKWLIEDFRNIHPMQIFQRILRNLDIQSNDQIISHRDDLETKFYKSFYPFRELMQVLYERNFDGNNVISDDDWEILSPRQKLIKISSTTWNDYNKRFKKIQEVMYYSNYVMEMFRSLVHVNDPNYDNSMNQDISLYKFITNPELVIEEEEKAEITANSSVSERDHQKVIRYLFDICKRKRFSRYQDCIYRPVTTTNNNYAYSAIQVGDLDNFVYKYTSRDENYQIWNLTTKDKATIRYVKEYLKDCLDSALPVLTKNRYFYAFTDGIYQLYQEKDGSYTDKFYPYSNMRNERPELEPNQVCNKYFDCDFNFTEHEHWYDIPTPNIQKVLDLQFSHFKEYRLICEWMYIFMGRLLYEVGKLDGWQVITFIIGLAGTGKGTIIKAIMEFFEIIDVGTLSNDSEIIFGLSAIYDKLVFVAPEIKGDLKIPQAVFQSIVSGEQVSVPRKFKTAESVQWNVPGILAGNELPNWTDNAGSIARRLTVFDFMKKVPKSQLDPNLSAKIKANVPNLLRKCNLAYLEAVNQFASRNVWDVLPKYFLQKQEEISEQTNELKKFLKRDDVHFGRNYYISEKELRIYFHSYLKINKKQFTYDPTKLNEPLQTLNEQFNTDITLVKIDKRSKFIKAKMKENTEFSDKSGLYITGLSIENKENGDLTESENFVNFLHEIHNQKA